MFPHHTHLNLLPPSQSQSNPTASPCPTSTTTTKTTNPVTLHNTALISTPPLSPLPLPHPLVPTPRNLPLNPSSPHNRRRQPRSSHSHSLGIPLPARSPLRQLPPGPGIRNRVHNRQSSILLRPPRHPSRIRDDDDMHPIRRGRKRRSDALDGDRLPPRGSGAEEIHLGCG